jgi:heat shock protein HslJ
MKISHLFCAVLFAMLASLSCKDSSTTPTEQANPIVAIKNVPFWLRNLSLGDSTVNLNNYASFRFSIGDTIILGNDGCNYYTGKYSVSNGIITMTSISSTMMDCAGPPQLSPCRLLHGWNITIADTMLALKRNDTTFTFSSPYTKSVGGFSFTGKMWSFASSNDTTYQSGRTPNLIPALRMISDRQFGGRWYYNHQYAGTGEYDIGGYFAIGEGQIIYFHGIYSSFPIHPGEPSTDKDLGYMYRMLRSDHFSYTDSTLRLENRAGGYYYDFVPMQE